MDDLSSIECNHELPLNFNYSEVDFLSLNGRGMEILRPLQNLTIKKNGKIRLLNFQDFENDVISKISCPARFGVTVEDTNLTSLQFRSPFQNSNLNFIELRACQLGQFILISGFYGSDIDEILIKTATEDSMAPAFRRDTQIGSVKVRKLRIEDGGVVYKKNSLTGRFGIDSILINKFLFEYLEELEIINTEIEFIEDGCLERLEYLKVLKLMNVGLKRILEASVNWLSGGQIQSLFVGKEKEMTGLADDFLCFFVNLNSGQEIGKTHRNILKLLFFMFSFYFLLF